MQDFLQLKRILADPACAEWVLANVTHGGAPTFVDGQLCFQFEDYAEAERFWGGGLGLIG